MAFRKKLYFDVSFRNGTMPASAVRSFPCTQFRTTRSYTGDNYGNVLKDLPACTATTPNTIKAKSEVSAYFVPAHGVYTGALGVTLGFALPTTIASAATLLTVPSGRPGTSAIYTRHFGVLLRSFGTATIYGRVIVARPHSIEV